MNILETERLILRRVNMGDVGSLQGIFSDPEAMRYYPGLKDEKETREWIERTLNSYQKYGFGLWIALFKENLDFAGQCGLILQEVEERQEVERGERHIADGV